MKIFSVYDSKANAYMQPFFSPTAGTALRAFETIANEEGHEFCKHAADYTLFEIGEWDEFDGQLIQLEAKVNLGLAIELKRLVPLHAPPGPRVQPTNSQELEDLTERVERFKAIQGGE